MDLDIKYENMEKLSKTIKEKADEYLAQINLMYEKITELDDYWKGPDKDYFVSEVENYKKKFYDLKDILDDYSTLVLDISNNNKELEVLIERKTKEL